MIFDADIRPVHKDNGHTFIVQYIETGLFEWTDFLSVLNLFKIHFIHFIQFSSTVNSVRCVTAIGIDAGDASAAHGHYKPVHVILPKSIPLFNEEVAQLCKGCPCLNAKLDSSSQLLPQQFDRIQVRRRSWPLHACDGILLQVVYCIIQEKKLNDTDRTNDILTIGEHYCSTDQCLELINPFGIQWSATKQNIDKMDSVWCCKIHCHFVTFEQDPPFTQGNAKPNCVHGYHQNWYQSMHNWIRVPVIYNTYTYGNPKKIFLIISM